MSAWFREHGFDEVADALLVGALPQDAADVAALAAAGVTRVLNLVEDVEYRDGGRETCEAAYADAGIEERRVPLVDFGNLAADRLTEAVAVLRTWQDEGQRIYVHCRAGRQRSAAVVAAALALRDGSSLLEALERVRRRRSVADPLDHQRADLAAWWVGRRRDADPA